MKNIEEFLSYLNNLDIGLSIDGQRLRCNAPKGGLTPDIRAELDERKDEIIAFVRKTNLAPTFTLEPIRPISRNGTILLSLNQQRLWFLQQIEIESTTYNEFFAVSIKGLLQISHLEQSLQEIIQRHEVLRTTFPNQDGYPIQAIALTLAITLPVVDLQALPKVERPALIQQLSKEVQRPFDLVNGPLLRFTLVQLEKESYVLLLCMHHIVYDSWSMGIFIQELSSLYQASCAGEPSPLPELPIQYADFAVWQRQWLSGEVLKTQLNHWQQQLHGAPSRLQLPTDRPRPSVQTYQGRTESFTLNRDLTQKLQSLSGKSGTTLFMTLLAAFATLLYRYSGQSDILIGSPIANRNRSEIESLIGFFANTLVLRTSFEDNPSFEKLLAQVRETTLKAYKHQDVPFDQVVEALQPQRSLSHSPLFQVMFVLQNTPMSELELPGVTLTQLEAENTIARFDLTLSITETDRGLVGSWEYNTDLFDGSTIERITNHFENLLSAIVCNPQQRVSELPLLSTAESQQLLVEWNDTQAEYPQNKCIHQLFEVQVERTPEAVAIIFEDQQLTYQQLNQRANQLASHLQTLGVRPEVLVGICIERSIEMVVGLLGILKAGGAYVPLDPSYPQERLSYMLSDSGVEVLLTHSELLSTLPSPTAQVVCLDSDWGAIEQHSQENLDVEVDEDNLAYVIYTSGSTGLPKGAMNSLMGIRNRLLWMQDAYQLTSSDCVLQKTPFSFDVSVWEFFWALLTGARIVVAKPEGHKDSNYLINLIVQEQVTTMHFVPSMLQVFLQEDSLENCSSLKQVFCSGEALSFELKERFFEHLECELHNLYGPTEAAIDVTFWQCQPQENPQLVPIGRPIANTQIYILDRQMQPVPIGVTGELYIGGDGLARGYLNRPELTQEKFIPNLFSPDKSARLYKTGDLARYLPDGNIEFLGRIDHQVKIRGFRIELGEIESLLNAQEQVESCVVIAAENTLDNKRLVAYIVTESKSLSTKQLREQLKQQLPEYMVPSTYVFLDTLPLTPNGKIDRFALPAPDREITLSTEAYVKPQTELERMTATIWQEVLQIEQVGIHDNFFELGGHSLLATQLIHRMHKTFQVELPLSSFFEAATIAKLAELIEEMIIEKIEELPEEEVGLL
jgi:amino acid adenylation domain-containing protein